MFLTWFLIQLHTFTVTTNRHFLFLTFIRRHFVQFLWSIVVDFHLLQEKQCRPHVASHTSCIWNALLKTFVTITNKNRLDANKLWLKISSVGLHLLYYHAYLQSISLSFQALCAVEGTKISDLLVPCHMPSPSQKCILYKHLLQEASIIHLPFMKPYCFSLTLMYIIIVLYCIVYKLYCI